MIAGTNGDPSYYGYHSLLTGWNFIVQIGFNPDCAVLAGGLFGVLMNEGASVLCST